MDAPPALSALDTAPLIAKALGKPRHASDTLVRVLQRNDPPLYPLPNGRGGGRNAAPHTVVGGNNMVLGHADNGQAINKPVLIQAYRAIPVRDGAGWPSSVAPENPGELVEAVRAWRRTVQGYDDAARWRLVPGETLGEALDNTVDWLARPEGRVIRGLFRSWGLWWDLGVGYPHPPCSVGCATDAAIFRTHYVPRGFWPLAPADPDADPDADPQPGLTTTARLHFKVFELLADLWADAKPTSHPAPRENTRRAKRSVPA